MPLTEVTGDATKGASVETHALSLLMPVVLETELLDVTDPINDKAQSGKDRGTTVIVDDGTTLYLGISSGDKPDDVWLTAAGVAIVAGP